MTHVHAAAVKNIKIAVVEKLKEWSGSNVT